MSASPIPGMRDSRTNCIVVMRVGSEGLCTLAAVERLIGPCVGQMSGLPATATREFDAHATARYFAPTERLVAQIGQGLPLGDGLLVSASKVDLSDVKLGGEGGEIALAMRGIQHAHQNALPTMSDGWVNAIGQAASGKWKPPVAAAVQKAAAPVVASIPARPSPKSTPAPPAKPVNAGPTGGTYVINLKTGKREELTAEDTESGWVRGWVRDVGAKRAAGASVRLGVERINGRIKNCSLVHEVRGG